jgi:glutamine cyclotransferase
LTRQAQILGEFTANSDGAVHGVSFDGVHVWAATGDRMRSFDPGTGKIITSLDVPAHAGTAFDGRYLFQISEAIIRKVDPLSGEVVHTIPAPGGGSDSGLAWADGYLWVGQYRDRQIVQIDPRTGVVKRIIQSSRVVTGVTWVDSELWHGFSDDGDGGIARIDPANGNELETLEMPAMSVSGVESDGGDRFFCGGGHSGLIRIVNRG